MKYSAVNPFEYARGMYLIKPDNSVYFDPETPPEIKERFLKDWERILKEREERAARGDFSL